MDLNYDDKPTNKYMTLFFLLNIPKAVKFVKTSFIYSNYENKHKYLKTGCLSMKISIYQTRFKAYQHNTLDPRTSNTFNL